MKMRRLVIALGVVAYSAVAMLGFGAGAGAVTCPTGSLKQGEASSYAECNIPEAKDGEDGLMKTVTKILDIVVGVLAVAAVAVIIIGGIMFVTSTGDAAKIAKAKNAIIYGLVGLVVAMLAWAIVGFVINTVFGGGGTPKTV